MVRYDRRGRGDRGHAAEAEDTLPYAVDRGRYGEVADRSQRAIGVPPEGMRRGETRQLLASWTASWASGRFSGVGWLQLMTVPGTLPRAPPPLSPRATTCREAHCPGIVTAAARRLPRRAAASFRWFVSFGPRCR